MSSNFLHSEVSPLQISLQYPLSGKIIKEMPGSVASWTHCISNTAVGNTICNYDVPQRFYAT